MARNPRNGLLLQALWFPPEAFGSSSSIESLCLTGFHLGLPTIGQLHKDILQIGHERTNFVSMHAHSLQLSLKLGLSNGVAHQGVNGTAEDRRAMHEWQSACATERSGYIFGCDLKTLCARRRDLGNLPQGIRRAVCDKFAVIDVRQMRAA